MKRASRNATRRSERALIEPLERRQLLAAAALHVQGNHLETSGGQTVRLVGTNVPSLVWQNTGDRIQESIAAMIDDWKANTIRLPLSQDRWFGYAAGQSDGGADYRAQVDAAVAAVVSRNSYILLDLHWSDVAVWGQNPNQYRMADNNSTTFWSNVATRYANNSSVLFDLYNEPHDVDWNTWKNGGSVADSPTFQSPGMQSLLNTVRATGASNIVVAGGLDWGYDLSGVLNGYALSDPTGNLMYGAHVYPFKGNWAYNFGDVAKQYPVFVGEFGQGSFENSEPQFNAPTTWTPRLLDYLDARGIGWTAWSTYTTTTPYLISDWNFTPTAWGQQVRDRLSSYLTTNNAQPLFGPTIGTTGSWGNPNSGVYTGGSAANSVFDGDLNTFFDAPAANWDTAWVGQDLGVAKQITKVAFAPRPGEFAPRMTGGKFQGSNTADFSSGVVTLYTVPSTPASSWQTVNVIDAGSYRYIRYLTPTGGGANSAEIMFYGNTPASSSTLPSGWTSGDIGSPSRAGSSAYSNGVYTISGSGNDIWNSSDQFQYASQSVTGDQTIIARVTGVNWTDDWGKAGLMFRDDTSAGARNVIVEQMYNNEVTMQWRDTAGAPAASTGSRVGGTTSVKWLKLVKSGTTFSGYYATTTATPASGDWVLIATHTTTLNSTYRAGLAVTAHNPNANLNATFSNVSVSPTGSQSSLPSGWISGDVGAPSRPGSSAYTGGVYTISGAGTDVWDAADQFQYASQSISGNQTIVAHVTGMNWTHDWGKAGVMFRNDMSAGSMNVYVAQRYDNQVTMQWRDTTGGTSASVAAPVGGTASVKWLKLVRNGNSFSGYYATTTGTPASGDWVLIATHATTLNSSYRAGLAVTSHNTNANLTATFNNVSVTSGAQLLTIPAQSKTLTFGDIGSPRLVGSASLSGSTYTLRASGGDIWSTGDQFGYDRTSVAGDQTLVTRITSLSNTHAYAKAGLMFRDSTAANSAYVMVDVNPNGRVEFTIRKTTGASAVSVATATANTPSSSKPVWFKLVRAGGAYTAYYATGTTAPSTWKLIGSTSAVVFTNTTYLEGLVVNSHNNASPATALFDHVSS